MILVAGIDHLETVAADAGLHTPVAIALRMAGATTIENLTSHPRLT